MGELIDDEHPELDTPTAPAALDRYPKAAVLVFRVLMCIGDWPVGATGEGELGADRRGGRRVHLDVLGDGGQCEDRFGVGEDGLNVRNCR
ncbi:hypothetical protein [Nocardia sp. NPDC051981]|uniref:hypothetical protein n=1 Tax=Nocardia sp. NPDC051981 TaxID=3155417 RepID=UPI0034444E96